MLENWILEEKIAFLKDQQKDKKRRIGGVDVSHVRNELKRPNRKRRLEVSSIVKQLSTSGMHAAEAPVQLYSKQKQISEASRYKVLSSKSKFDGDKDWEGNKEYEPQKAVVWWKIYLKVHSFSIIERSCVLADRRMTSVRQQSDLWGQSLEKIK